ncbi:MAG: transcriptional regulator [Acidimicrobiales bacterium]|nr:MAG: transcriptional regulator [Acidimicrobiales bacterium]
MGDTTPIPGRPVRGSRTGQPIMALLDLLGRAWAMGVVWQLGNGPLTFRALQRACENVSPSLLNRRLKELRTTGLVDHDATGYHLTSLGLEALALLQPLGSWADRWAEQIAGDDTEP